MEEPQAAKETPVADEPSPEGNTVEIEESDFLALAVMARNGPEAVSSEEAEGALQTLVELVENDADKE